MDSWSVVPLVIFVVIRDIWHWLSCPACRIATRSVAKTHPEWKLQGTSHRASEPHRDVVAVFYSPPDFIAEPSPYLLVAVDRLSRGVLELPTTPDSPYWIHGRK